MEVVDVVVVGAGMAGLHCASMLKQAGLLVKVVEARPRVGGRLAAAPQPKAVATPNKARSENESGTYHSSAVTSESAKVAPDLWDIGGQWIGPQQKRVLELVRRHGVELIEQFEEGKTIFVEEGGKRSEYAGVYPPAFEICIKRLDALSREVPRLEPWKAEKAKLWDGITVAGWIESEFPREQGITGAHTGLRGLMASEPGEISLLTYLHYIAASPDGGKPEEQEADEQRGRVSFLADTKGGAQLYKLKGTAWNLCNKIYESELQANTVFNHAVFDVQQNSHNGSALVSAWDNTDSSRFKLKQWQARKVVIALPPPLIPSIRFSPPLPFSRAHLNQRYQMAGVIKSIFFYDRPFWRERGFSGLAIDDRDDQPVQLTYDGCSEKHFALVVFTLGRAARIWTTRSTEERKDAITKALCLLYATDEALEVRGHLEQCWCNEPYSLGGYVAVPSPGTLTTCGSAIREPFRAVHWAGTETARQWPGYIEGAIESGERAASEVLASIPKGTTSTQSAARL